MSPRRSLRAFALVCVAALVAVGCGGGGDDDSDAAATTTSSTTTTSTTTTAAPVAPKAALTGLPVTDPAVLTRPTMLVKINNADGKSCDLRARPQVGLDQADIVIEEEVEGGITRFMAAFQSVVPETVGPVRSARSSDIDLLLTFNTPLFSWSGNNGNVQGELNNIGDRYVAVGHSSAAGNMYYRDNNGGRCAPSNLFVHPAELYDFAKDKGKPATPVFTYLADGETVAAAAPAVAGVKINTALDTAYVWNATSATWDRFQKRTRHTVVGDVQISPNNVVVLDIPYKGSSTAGSPEAVSVGAGAAHVYVGGKVIEGTWKKDSPEAPWTLTDAAGAPIKLTPGRTWVQLARDSNGPPTNLDAAGVAPYTAA
jgi:Protein of unknown function (DUF3048) N-terminal domain/Protein of unknown function (DUF3048) C-terminal domain